jgi:hypothetical protein
MGKFSWKDAPDLMDRLGQAQNAPFNSNIDIMTFAGMCDSRDELERHVVRYEERADLGPNAHVAQPFRNIVNAFCGLR